MCTASRLLCVVALLAAPATSGAQASRVYGVVFDSVSMAPLAGAIVQAAQVMGTAGGSPRIFTGTTDHAGRYQIDSLPVGSYGIAFQHPLLTALGLEPPLRAFQLSSPTAAEINLAVPPGSQVRRLTCADAAADTSDALLAGFVTDAHGAVLAGSTVTARWTELGVVDRKFRTVQREAVASARDDGSYHLCGIAADGAGATGCRATRAFARSRPNSPCRYPARLTWGSASWTPRLSTEPPS